MGESPTIFAEAGRSKPSALLDDDDPALFPKLTDEQLALLSPLGHVRTIDVGEVLFRSGDMSYDPMVLLEGRVAVIEGSIDSGRELALQLPRDLMVELNVFTGQRLGATGVVREAGSVLVLPVAEFRALVGRELEFGDFVLQTLFRRRRFLERLRVGIPIVGSPVGRDTLRLREFAARNRILTDWINPDDPRAHELLGVAASDARSAPIVVLGSGAFIRNPTNAELAEAVGLRRAPIVIEDSYDLLVVGAGPAGLAAAVYGASGGMLTAILDAVAVGGQAATSARIENYLGFPTGLSGAELAERAELKAEKFKAQIMVPREAIGLRERDGFYRVKLDDGDDLVASSVILAVGVQYRRLPIPRLADYEGLGVAYATDSARQQLRPSDAAVVIGGANSAGQTALALAEDGHQVHLIVRAGGLERSMARYLRDRIALEPAIHVHLQHEVRELGGDGHLERVVVEDVTTGQRQTLAAGAMVVLIGAEPRTQWLAGELALDADGFVLTGPALGPDASQREPWLALGRGPFVLETSRPGVFAVGDVRSGATRMVAPAVGEGGMAVRLAAEHLASDRQPVRSVTS